MEKIFWIMLGVFIWKVGSRVTKEIIRKIY